MEECKTWSKFCVDPTKIEGYDRAINDTSNTRYDCHHRLETHFSDGTLRPVPVPAFLLEYHGLYNDREPEELIIITDREHKQLHHLAEGNNTYASKEEAKEARKEQSKQRYQANRVEELERSKRYYENHKEQQAEQMKQWYEANKSQYKRRSKVSHWIKKHPTSTDFPKTWNDEDIKLFYELSK